MFDNRLTTLYSTVDAVENSIAKADLVIGAVLVPGDAAPKIMTPPMLKLMAAGTVLVDVAIDQGGCLETSKPNTHQEPTYLVAGIVHYCVDNRSEERRVGTECVRNSQTRGWTNNKKKK